MRAGLVAAAACVKRFEKYPMPKVVLKGHITVSAEDLLAVLEELPRHIALTREEEGCLQFDVEQSSQGPRIFSVHEVFADRLAFDLHQLRARNSAWGKVAVNVERRYTVTEVS